VRLAVLVEWPPALDLVEDLTGIDALAPQHRVERRPVAQVAAMVVSQGEQRQVRAGEPLGEAVAHDDPDLAGEQVRFARRVLPRPRVALLDVCLVE